MDLNWLSNTDYSLMNKKFCETEKFGLKLYLNIGKEVRLRHTNSAETDMILSF